MIASLTPLHVMSQYDRYVTRLYSHFIIAWYSQVQKSILIIDFYHHRSLSLSFSLSSLSLILSFPTSLSLSSLSHYLSLSLNHNNVFISSVHVTSVVIFVLFVGCYGHSAIGEFIIYL